MLHFLRFSEHKVKPAFMFPAGGYGHRDEARPKKAMLAVAPPIFSGSILFIMMMVLGLGSICTCLSILAVRMKKKRAMVLFILAFLASMGMVAMSGQESS